MARKYQVISGDSHLDLAPDQWTHRVPAKWKDRAPRRLRLENGEDLVFLEGRPPLRIGFTRITGVPYDQFHKQIPSYDGPGAGRAERRVSEQDQDGIDAEVLFTHGTYLNFWRGIRENEGYKTLIRAYNGFLAEEYCACAPDRLIAMGMIPDTGVDDAIAEMEFCARAGLKGVALYKFPSGKGYPSPEDDRFWAAALDMQMPVTAHTNGGSTRFTREGPVFPYPRGQADGGERGGERDPISLLFRFCGDSAFAPVQLAFAGVFDRFPELQIYWAETQIGWLPFSFYQIEDSYARYRYIGEDLWGLEPPARGLSEYLREHNLWGFLADPFGVSMRHQIGVDRILWGSDFAHAASDWPRSRQVIEEVFAGVPEDDLHLMLAGNAVRFFRLQEEARSDGGRREVEPTAGR